MFYKFLLKFCFNASTKINLQNLEKIQSFPKRCRDFLGKLKNLILLYLKKEKNFGTL